MPDLRERERESELRNIRGNRRLTQHTLEEDFSSLRDGQILLSLTLSTSKRIPCSETGRVFQWNLYWKGISSVATFWNVLVKLFHYQLPPKRGL